MLTKVSCLSDGLDKRLILKSCSSFGDLLGLCVVDFIVLQRRQDSQGLHQQNDLCRASVDQSFDQRNDVPDALPWKKLNASNKCKRNTQTERHARNTKHHGQKFMHNT